jgi:hypothetical protein
MVPVYSEAGLDAVRHQPWEGRTLEEVSATTTPTWGDSLFLHTKRQGSAELVTIVVAFSMAVAELA